MTDTKYKTEATERKAPRISVSAHIEDCTKVDVRRMSDGSAMLDCRGYSYSSVSLFMTREKLAELRDTISAYLDAAQ